VQFGSIYTFSFIIYQPNTQYQTQIYSKSHRCRLLCLTHTFFPSKATRFDRGRSSTCALYRIWKIKVKCFYLTDFLVIYVINCGPRKLSRYSDWLRAGSSEIESRWGRDFPPVQNGPGAHPSSCKMGTGSFPRGKVRPGRAADHSPPSSAAV
jgi:hypothetical protein